METQLLQNSDKQIYCGNTFLFNYNCIYVYEIPDINHEGLLKIGQTSFKSYLSINQLTPNHQELVQNAKKRINEQTKTALVPYNLLYTELASIDVIMDDGSKQNTSFQDKDIHKILKSMGYNPKIFTDSGKDSEWYPCDLDIVKKAISLFKTGKESTTPIITFKPTIKDSIKLRKEQIDNIEKTFKVFSNGEKKFLWDCKMRYGKTITAYSLVKKAQYQKVIVITHRPAVRDSWRTDHAKIFTNNENLFIDRNLNNTSTGSNSYAKNDAYLEQISKSGTPFVYFTSIQYLHDSSQIGGKFNKNNTVFKIDWDLVIIDEAHEGMRTDNADPIVKKIIKENSKLLELTGTAYEIYKDYDDHNTFKWTYIDEQRSKRDWYLEHPDEPNPYAELPRMNILTFNLADSIKNSYRYVEKTSDFSFREFFRVWTGDPEKDLYKMSPNQNIGDFVYENDVVDFLDLISKDSPDSNYPFSTEEKRINFAHTFWIVPGVKEAAALSKLLKNHPVFGAKDANGNSVYGIANVAGAGDEEQPYNDALSLVRSVIESYDKSITISCGKLTTGVTVKEWSAVMVLSGSSSTSAKGYMQAIFRVQSPHTKPDGSIKTNCYVFDFAPDRTLKVISDVISNENFNTGGGHGPEKPDGPDIPVFLEFLPIISIEDSKMVQLDEMRLMHKIKSVSIDNAINSGFDDTSVYLKDAGIVNSEFDQDILNKIWRVLKPTQRKRSTDVNITTTGLTPEDLQKANKLKKNKSNTLSLEEKVLLEKYKLAKKEQNNLFKLLRTVSIRLPLLFYGVDADINKHFKVANFIDEVDDESWEEFMPKGFTKDYFKALLRFYDEDVVLGAGMRIRNMAKAADELPPTKRARRIIDILSSFKNPDQETVLTPWAVVNMHLCNTIGGYSFYDEDFKLHITDYDEPKLIDQKNITSDLFLNDNVKILEMNSKSGLYPLFMAYSVYMLKIDGKEYNYTLAESMKIWQSVLDENIFVLCKTKMAKSITEKTLAGYTGLQTKTIYLPKLVASMKDDLPKLTKKIRNPNTWGKEGDKLNFDAVVGNPPYSGNNHQQIYPFFYKTSIELGKYVSMIFPTGWQGTGTANNLGQLNNKEIKEDPQIMFIDNRENVFEGIPGASKVNIILWKKGYDNGLNGKQRIYTNGTDEKIEKLLYDKSEIKKPDEIIALAEIVKNRPDFVSLREITSVRKPYGLSTDVIEDYAKYELEPFQDEKLNSEDITVYAKRKNIAYIPKNYKLPKISNAINKFKVFIPYAWGAMNENSFLGGSFSDIIIGLPNEICTETYLESGCFEDYNTTKRHSKYLMSKFCRALIFLNKNSQHSTRSWGAIPTQTYTESWWDTDSIDEIDEHLFDKYDVPENIREFIRKNIQPRTIENITNYK